MNSLTLPPHLKRFRLGLTTPDLGEPIHLMRSLGPFSAMVQEDPRLELVYPHWLPASAHRPAGWDVGWCWLSQCDAIFYSHPANEFDVSVLWLARQMGVPVWSEYVDDIFSVHPTNPHWQEVGRNKRALQQQVSAAIQLSTVVTAVSDLCAAAYPHPERILVIPEACRWEPWDLPRQKMVTWRGLASHYGDVETVLPQLCAVARDFPDWTWGLMGEPTEEFVAQLAEACGETKDAHGFSRVKLAPYYSTPWHAIQAWGGCAPYLHLVPLADTPFNRAKSHLAWLEATAIGAAVIAPDYLPEWQQPGVIPYEAGGQIIAANTDRMTFETVLRRELLTYREGEKAEVRCDGVEEIERKQIWSGGLFHPNVRTARAAIYPDRTLPAMNQRRWAVLRKLAEAARPLTPALSPGERENRSQPRGQPLPPLPEGEGRGEGESAQCFQSRSQAGQDQWVYELFGPGYRGTFLDIGPVEINNTVALERMGWRGLLVDKDDWSNEVACLRTSPFRQADATKANWLAMPINTPPLDYLSLDTEPVTLEVLKTLLAQGVRFRAATIAHDAYHLGPAQRDEMRRLLTAAGYTLARVDVEVKCADWWVDEKLLPPLTPALSPGERENRRQPAGTSPPPLP